MQEMLEEDILSQRLTYYLSLVSICFINQPDIKGVVLDPVMLLKYYLIYRE